MQTLKNIIAAVFNFFAALSATLALITYSAIFMYFLISVTANVYAWVVTHPSESPTIQAFVFLIPTVLAGTMAFDGLKWSIRKATSMYRRLSFNPIPMQGEV